MFETWARACRERDANALTMLLHTHESVNDAFSHYSLLCFGVDPSCRLPFVQAIFHTIAIDWALGLRQLIEYKNIIHLQKSKNYIFKFAMEFGSVQCVKILSTYVAPGKRMQVFESRRVVDNTLLNEWMLDTFDWTPLHFVEMLSSERTVKLLRDGANLHNKDVEGRTPWSMAKQLAATLPAARLILQANEPWNVNNHHLFPSAQRKRAVELFLMGRLIDRSFGEMFDVWMHHVIPLDVTR